MTTTNDIDAIRNLTDRAMFIAAARTHVPALCDEVEQLRAELAACRRSQARDQLAALQVAAELEKVRAQLTDANRALDGYKADERSLTAANTALANENARLRHALLDLAKSSGKTHVWDHEQTDWVPIAQFAAAKAEVAR